MENSQKIKLTKPTKFIVVGMTLITIYFNPNLQDPFNAPKFWILLVLAGALIPYLLMSSDTKKSTNKTINYLLIIFAAFGTLSAINSDNPTISFFGDTMRKNGITTYLSLIIILYALVKYFKIIYIIKYSNYFLFISVILILYGLLQLTGKDFITWNNPYNAIILTTGNPNFSSALFSIIASFFSIYILNSKNHFTRFCYLLLITVLIFMIWKTNSLQGILSFLGAVSISFIIYLYNKHKKLGSLAIIIFCILLVSTILGLLKRGPLQGLVYKESFDTRIFYWKAALEMTKDNPIFGVGIDNYGNYFNQYREIAYPLKYGFDVTSTNAHNVYLQHLATGGLIFGLSYILIQIVIFRSFLRAMTKPKDRNTYLVLAVFSGWMAYQIQSLVSIDNLTLSIWGWVLGGILLSTSQIQNLGLPGNKDKNQGKLKAKEALAIQTSSFITILLIIFCSLFYRSEKLMFEIRKSFNPQNQQSNEIVYRLGSDLLKIPFTDINYRSTLAIYLADSGYFEVSERIQLDSLSQAPDSYETLSVLANLYETYKMPEKAILLREQIILKNPYNAKNLLQLAKNYKIIGNDIMSSKYLAEIKLITGNNIFYSEAVKELESLLK
jgi:O-antigen ligase